MRQRKCHMGLDLGLCPYIPLPCSPPSSPSSSSSSSSSSDATSFFFVSRFFIRSETKEGVYTFVKDDALSFSFPFLSFLLIPLPHPKKKKKCRKSHHHHLHRRHVAILHDGRACALDLTELQARAILMLARQEAESRDTRPPASPKSRLDGSTYYMWRPRGVSMKRSLQRFLQGRRSRSRTDRAQENSPYNNRITTTTANHRRTDNDNQN